MCLISETNQPTIATEDIVCYKIITPENRTPCTNTHVNILHRLGVKPFKAKGDIIINISASGRYYNIEGGMIHTFCNLNYTLIHADNFAIGFPIYECIIPKGTEYFVSSDEEEYCSKKIIFKKRIR